MEKVALVTGSSSGIGYETSLALAREGYTTYATMRDVSKGKKIQDVAKNENLKVKILELDVDKPEQIKSAVEKIIKDEKRIDVLVNNAGYGIFGAVEDVTIDEYKAQFETNLFGVIRLIQEVAPIMRKQADGFIINISSVAGRIGFPGTPAYISSKFALEGLSESLRYELGQFGVKVIIIEPGVIKTNFFASRNIDASLPTTYLGNGSLSFIDLITVLATSLGSVPNSAIILTPEMTLSVISLYGESGFGCTIFIDSKKFVLITPGSIIMTFTPN